MGKHTYQGALHILAPMICERDGVKLRFGGTEAYCTRDEIGLPDLPPGNDEARIYGLAYLNHELEHFEDTDFGVLAGLTKAEHGITNILEDIRIEKGRGKRYPGAKVVFAQVDELLVKNGEYGSDAQTPYAAMHDYMLLKLRHIILGHQVVAEVAEKAGQTLRGKIPENAVTRLDGLMVQVANFTTTSQCAILAKSILKMLEEEKKAAEQQPKPPSQPADQPNQPQQGQGQQSGDPQSGADGAEASQGQKPPSGQEDANAPPQGAGQSSDGQGEPKGEGAGASPGGQEAADALAQILAGDGAGDVQDSAAKLAQQLGNLANDSGSSEKLGVTTLGHVKNGNGDTTMLAEVAAATNALRRRLSALLQAQTLAKVSITERGSRIDFNRLPNLKRGDLRIFKRRDEGLAIDTAISILVDISGSMDGNPGDAVQPIELAKRAALAAAMAFSALPGIKVSVSVFPYHGTTVAQVKGFDERVQASADRYQSLRANGGTPMAEAIVGAGRALCARREARKLMLVATDGGPSKPEATKGLIEDLGHMGIEMLGLGIQTSLVSEFFPTHGWISNLDQLAPAIINMLRDQVFFAQAA